MNLGAARFCVMPEIVGADNCRFEDPAVTGVVPVELVTWVMHRVAFGCDAAAPPRTTPGNGTL